MGCDIHLYAERREGGRWVSADEWVVDDVDDPYRRAVPYGSRFYRSRNYDLFAILASVRNGSGFAGVVTGGGFVPVLPAESEQAAEDAAPHCRGFPGDVSPEVRSSSDYWGADGHSHSWLTVAELLAYDWCRETTHVGWVDLPNWARWRQRGKPSEWSGGVGGGAVRHVPEAEVRAVAENVLGQDVYPLLRIANGHQHPEDLALASRLTAALGGGSVYTHVEWREPYRKSVSEFLSDTMPRLWRLGPPEDVRIVFWFDN